MSDKNPIMQELKDAATGSQAFDLDGDEWVKELDGRWRCQAFSLRASSTALYHSGGRLRLATPNVRLYLVVNNASGEAEKHGVTVPVPTGRSVKDAARLAVFQMAEYLDQDGVL